MEPSCSYASKLFRRKKKYSHFLQRETGISEATISKFLMVCNAGLVSGIQREMIVKIFSSYSLQQVLMIPGKSYCFVQFKSEAGAQAAFNTIHGKAVIPEVKGPLYLLMVEKMPENSFIHNNEAPSGLFIFDNFVSDEEEGFLLRFVETEFQNSGSSLKHRMVQHYGFEFNYETNDVNKFNSECKKMPDELDFIKMRFKNIDFIEQWIPNQLTINVYQPGHGIPLHVDSHSAFDDIILSLSVGSNIVMDFKNTSGYRFSAHLRNKSLLVMSRESRYAWSHGITPRKYDVIEDGFGLTSQKRGTRVSFTFRRIKENNACHCSYSTFCNSQKEMEKETELNIDNEVASQLEKIHVHEVYNGIANHFSETRHKPWPNIENFVKSFAPGSIFIDVGCGNGKYFGLNASVFQAGCDRSIKLVEEIRDKGYEAVVCDCLQLPFRSEIADYCVCIAVIHHLSTKERRIQALQEIVRIIRPRGLALIYVWARNQRKDKHMSTYLKQKSRSKQDNEEILAKTSSHSVTLSKLAKTETEYCEITLPVHVNRTQFKHDDVLVPWKFKPCGEASNTKTFLRYYHVFGEGELEKLCKHIENIEIFKSYYDQGNWCVAIKKLDCNSVRK